MIVKTDENIKESKFSELYDKLTSIFSIDNVAINTIDNCTAYVYVLYNELKLDGFYNSDSFENNEDVITDIILRAQIHINDRYNIKDMHAMRCGRISIEDYINKFTHPHASIGDYKDFNHICTGFHILNGITIDETVSFFTEFYNCNKSGNFLNSKTMDIYDSSERIENVRYSIINKVLLSMEENYMYRFMKLDEVKAAIELEDKIREIEKEYVIPKCIAITDSYNNYKSVATVENKYDSEVHFNNYKLKFEIIKDNMMELISHASLRYAKKKIKLIINY